MKKNEMYIPDIGSIKKLLKIMKVSFFLICVFTFQSVANSYAQSTKIDMSMKNATFKEIIEFIEEETEFYFMLKYDQDILKKRMDAEFKNANIREVLDELLGESGYSYKLIDRYIAISPIANVDNNLQQNTITGKVTDGSDQALPGVTVLVKGTTNGTVTNAEGEYSIGAVEIGSTIVFSFVGMITQEVIVGTQTTINVVMVFDAIGIEEVVAVGYGTFKKSDLTGSVASLKNDDFNQGAISSVDEAMQGRIPGVLVTQTSAEPGGGLSIRIRGASSINAGNEPLYVIDGMPMDNSEMLSSSTSSGIVAQIGSNPNPKNPLNSLNPNDIESIEILKDASATAIYGSRGANGVVLITTKMGKKDDLTIRYDVYGGVQTVDKKIDLLSTSQYIQGLNAIAEDMGNEPVFTSNEVSQIGNGTDWQDEVFRDAYVSNHNLSLTGGVNATKYFMSVNYYDQDGVVDNSGMKKYIARLNIEQGIGKRFKLGFNINASLVNSNNAIRSIAINEQAGVINSALLYDPTLPVKNEDGTFVRSPDLTINNPVSILEGISSINKTSRVFGNVSLEYDILESLSTKLNFGTDRHVGRRDLYNSRLTIHGAASGGIADISSLERANTLVEYTVTFDKIINDIHNFNMLAGITYQDFINSSFSSGIAGFPTDVLGTDNLGLGNNELAAVGSNKNGYTLLSYIGRINYSLFNKYLFTGSVRADGSSRFGENNKYGYFPSFAFAWKLHEEEFLPHIFGQLKFRLSWGITGNQEISNYASISTYSAGRIALLGNSLQVSTNPSRVANPDLKWESTEQFNAGIDFSIFDYRLSGTIDYFVKNTEDMLIRLPLPTSSGFNSILSNTGSMRNTGLEIMLLSRNVKRTDFLWNTTLNVATLKNEVKDIGELESIIMGGIQNVGNTTIVKPGHALNSYYGYKITGIFQSEEEVANSAQPGSKPGYPIFQDTDKSGSISPADQVILGDPFPDFTFGLNNTFEYKNFKLGIFFQGQAGAKLLNNNAIESMYPSNFRRNRIAEQVIDRWTPTNTNAKWPSSVQPSSYGGGKVSNLVVEDASYLRLKTIRLDYKINMNRSNSLKSLNVYVSAQNLFTITNYSGFNPEANAFGRSNVRIDYNSYPLSKVFLLGMNVEF